MRVVVVEPGPVGDDEVALQILQGDLALSIPLQVKGLILVVQQVRDLKATHILARILQSVVPAGDEVLVEVAADQLHGLGHDIHRLHAVHLNAVFGLKTKQPDSPAVLIAIQSQQILFNDLLPSILYRIRDLTGSASQQRTNPIPRTRRTADPAVEKDKARSRSRKG